NSRSYIYHLHKRARAVGVTIRTNARVIELLRTGKRITGVAAEIGGRTVHFTAGCGVVLTTGDYSSGREIKAKVSGEDRADIEGINEASTGDGHRMVLEIGADIVNGDVMTGPEIRFVAPPHRKLISMIPPWKPIALIMRWAMENMPPRLLRPFLMMFVTTNLA